MHGHTFLNLQITRSDRPDIKWAVILVIAYCYFNSLKGLCGGYVWVNIFTLSSSPPPLPPLPLPKGSLLENSTVSSHNRNMANHSPRLRRNTTCNVNIITYCSVCCSKWPNTGNFLRCCHSRWRGGGGGGVGVGGERGEKSLIAEWLGQASQTHEMYCLDQEVMGSNPRQVNLGCVLILSKLYFNLK